MRELAPIINGKKIRGQENVTITNPYDGLPVAEIGLAGITELESAVITASDAFAGYRTMPSCRRAELLRKIAVLMGDAQNELAGIIKEEAGKPIKLAQSEAARAIQTFETAADESLRLEGEVLPFEVVKPGIGKIGITRRFPIGPVLAISPFNFPLNLVAHKVAPALAAGNTVVLKPASQTASPAIRLAELCLEAGLPEGVFNVIPCRRAVADGLVADSRFKVLTFTGSAAVGWDLRARAGKKKVTLEIGGNAAAIVEPDADIEAAARKLSLGAFAYAGQVCISVQRIYVHESIAQSFIDQLVFFATTPGVWGNPNDPETICGPMIDEANILRILSWIDEARRSGGQVLCGGRRVERIVTPTILRDVPKQAKLVAEEAFGPVVVVDTYKTFDEALTKVNDSRYGLQAGVYTNDLRKVLKAFKELEVGGLIHNDYPTFRVDPMPYGGVKESGCGREGLRYAIEDLTELKLLVINE